jgi:hypothetical protein
MLNLIYAATAATRARDRSRQQRAQAPAETARGLERVFDYLRDYVALEDAKRQACFAPAAALADGLMVRQAELNRPRRSRIRTLRGYGPDWPNACVPRRQNRRARGRLLVVPPVASARPA